MNSGAGDYRLGSGSPAIDAGTPVGFPYVGRAPDLGALETGAAGTIQVLTDHTNAAFIVVGPSATYSGSGTNWSVSDATAGVYTITFTPIVTRYTPSFQAGTLQAGQTLVFTGNYAPDTLPPVGALAINHSEFATADPLVTLTLDFVDAVAGMEAGAQMRFSNNGTTWSPAEAYSTVKRNWDLSAFGGTTSPGTNTVYTMVSDALGNWTTTNAAIWYVPSRRILEVPTAYGTIQAAVDAALAGDIVHVAPGYYQEWVSLREGITLQGSGPARTIFTNGYSQLSTAPNTGIEGFGGYMWVIAQYGSVHIQNNEFCGSYGIDVGRAASVFVRNNCFKGSGWGLRVLGFDGPSVTVENNTFVNSTTAMELIDARPSARVFSRNNIFAYNSLGVVEQNYGDCVHQHIFSSYNTYWSNTNGNFGTGTCYSRMEVGDMNADPLFVARADGDFRLRAESTSIDSGEPERSYNDSDGTRNDRGAYGGPSLNTPPYANFVVTPAVGKIGTFFTFDAGTSFDRETDASKLLVRWDFDGDGTWDTAYSALKVVSIQFMNLGTFNTVLEVRDERGWLCTTNRQVRVENQSPLTPLALSVSNGAPSRPIILTLDWSGGDDDPFDTVTYDLYFGTAPSPPQVASDLAATSFAPPTLGYNTFYFWRVVATDNHGSTASSPVYSFLTESEPFPSMVIAVSFLPAQYLEVTFTNESGRSYTMQASTNLVDWLDLTNFISTNTISVFHDTDATNFGHRFYRVVSP